MRISENTKTFKLFTALQAGESVSPSTTKPYGCSVKYGK